MKEKLQRRIQRYGWDAAAPVYESGWLAQLRPAHDALVELADLGPGMRVLETACGTGLVTMRIADEVAPGGSVLATDISENMVAETARAAERHGASNVETTRGAAEEIELEADSFDAAVCALGLMYFPEPDKGLAAMGRAVRPGGTVTATVWGERRNCGWAGIFPIVDAAVESEVCPLFFALGAPEALARAFASNGLTDIQERRQSVVLEFIDDRAVIEAVIDGGAVALAAKRFSGETRRQVDAEFLESLASYRKDDGSYAIPGAFVTVRGTVA